MLVLAAHTRRVNDLRFSPDGRWPAAAGVGPGLRVYDPAAGAERFPAADPLPACPAVRWSADGGRLSALEPDAPAARDAATGVAVWVAGGPRVGLAVGPDGRVPAGDYVENRAADHRWIDPESGAAVGPPLRLGGQMAWAAAVAPDGRWVAAATASAVLLADPSTGEVVAEARLARGPGAGPAWAPDGRRLYYTDGPHVVAWDADARAEAGRGKLGTKSLKDVAVSGDGRLLLTVGNDRTAALWDAAGCRLLKAYEWKVGKLWAAALSPDGLQAAAGGESGRVVVWDVDA